MYASDRLHTSQTFTLTPVLFHQESSKTHPTVTPIAHQQPKPEIPHPNKPRRRGVILTEQGWQKLLQAEVIYNRFDERYTFEQLSSKVMLDPRTIGRIIDREVGVDKRTLTTFFQAFNLKLDKTDYTRLAIYKRDNYPSARIDTERQVLSPFMSNSEVEVAQLKQRIITNYHRLAVLLGLDRSSQATLSVKLSPQAPPQLGISLQQQYNLHLVL